MTILSKPAIEFFVKDRLDLIPRVNLFREFATNGISFTQYHDFMKAWTHDFTTEQHQKKNGSDYIVAAYKLFFSMALSGFKPEQAVRVDQWGVRRDGAHRVACAHVLDVNVIYKIETFDAPFVQNGNMEAFELLNLKG